MTAQVGRRTASASVYEQMRADILAARLDPGQRLKFPELCVRYDTSVGAAREVLARLAGERLVEQEPNKGYRVVALSAEKLTDLTTARVEIESATFRSAIAHGSTEWESVVVATHHRLSRLSVPDAGSSDRNWELWSQSHEQFHEALLAGCPSRRLQETARDLRGEAELYRRWSTPLGSPHSRDATDEHRQLAHAAVEREVERGSELLRAHISRTTEILLAGSAASPESDVVPST